MTNEEIKALEDEAAALELEAKASELSPEERARAEALARIQAAKETKAANLAKRRAAEMAAKEAQIRKALTDGTLVKGVDLYSLFPLGATPAHMPECGYVILCNPSPQASARKDADMQAGTKTAHEIGVDFVTACTKFPVAGDDGVRLGEFYRAHAEAVNELAMEVRALGGAKSRPRPLGRS